MEEIFSPNSPGNLQSYEKAYREFNWASVEAYFNWSKGGVYNIANEAVDRHGRGALKDRVALHSVQANGDVKSLTFGQLSRRSSQFADGLAKLGVQRGDRVFVYLDRTTELFISLIGIV
ncbi:MAG: AMP-binding protein, partial [Methanomassiliicoccales archaeon]|nr:AMP-binding protein [Methanomassiliicoccales archaeon]